MILQVAHEQHGAGNDVIHVFPDHEIRLPRGAKQKLILIMKMRRSFLKRGRHIARHGVFAVVNQDILLRVKLRIHSTTLLFPSISQIFLKEKLFLNGA